LLGLHLLPESLLAIENLHRAQLVVGFGATLLLGYLGWKLGRSALRDQAPAARFLLLGALISLVPMCSTLPMSRLALGAAIGVDAVLALLLVTALDALRRPMTTLRRVGHIAFVIAVFTVHVWGASARGHGDVDYYTFRSYLEEAWVLGADIDDEKVSEQQLMVIAARDWTSQWALPYVRKLQDLPLPASCDLLSGAMENPHTLVRVADGVLDLLIEGAPQSLAFTGSVYRPEDAPFHAGDKVHAARFDVEVMDVSDGQPARLRFRFPRSLDDGLYLLLYPREEGLTRVVPPAIGRRLELPAPALPHWPVRPESKARARDEKASDHQ
jgi:hypothetical protein